MTMKFYHITKSIDVTHKELWDSLDNDYKGLTAPVTLLFTKTNDDDKEKPRYRFVMSTDALDRHGERVYQDVDFTHFMKNPVVVDSHRYESIERIIGRVANPGIQEGKTVGDVEFFTDNPLGKLAQAGVEQGYINAGSIGFIPLGFDDEGNITSYELLEFSMVSIPANPEAVLEGKSIDNDTENVDEVVDDTVTETEEDETEAVSEQEDAEDTETKTIKVTSQTPDTYKVLIQKLEKRNQVIKSVAKQLQETKPQTLAERKRKIYSQLRDALKA